MSRFLAGATGVEVAGALGETVRHTLRSEYHAIHPEEVRILLFEGGSRVLPVYPTELSARAVQDLTTLGVTVCTNSLVMRVSTDSVDVRTGVAQETVSTQTILWAAGVQASPLSRKVQERTGAQLYKSGRLLVEPDLSLPDYPEIFVIGDLANYSHQTGVPLPGLVQPAMQEGAYVARLIQSRLKGETLPAFTYHDKGSLATIGRGSAIADLGKTWLTGLIAKLVWIFIHIWNIMQVENRALVLVQWSWNFLTMSQRARIITGQVIPVTPPTETQGQSSPFEEDEAN